MATTPLYPRYLNEFKEFRTLSYTIIFQVKNCGEMYAYQLDPKVAGSAYCAYSEYTYWR